MLYFQKSFFFISLKIYFVSVNRADPNEMLQSSLLAIVSLGGFLSTKCY